MAHKITFTMLMALLLAGCAPHPLPKPVVPHTYADVKIMLTVQPSPPRQLDPTRFTVTLRDGHGKPINGAGAQMNLEMPSMDMGQDAVTLSPQAAGVYTGTGRFTMSGDWHVTVTVAQGSERSVQSFPVTVR